jgi:hypothetical protein
MQPGLAGHSHAGCRRIHRAGARNRLRGGALLAGGKCALYHLANVIHIIFGRGCYSMGVIRVVGPNCGCEESDFRPGSPLVSC